MPVARGGSSEDGILRCAARNATVHVAIENAYEPAETLPVQR